MATDSPNPARIAEVVRTGLAGKQILVIGDLMLDQYVWGDVSRISPEAPVPVLRHGRDATRAGGAGNVALNLAGLGLDVAIAGFAGADEARKTLLEIFAEANVDTACVTTLGDRPTVTKTRIIAGHQHVLRVDSEDLSEVDKKDAASLLQQVQQRIKNGIDGIILSDYAKGALSTDTCRQIIDAAASKSIPVFVDPKGQDYDRYAGASVLTPNLAELELASGAGSHDIDTLITAGREIVSSLGLDYLVVTRGANGMTLISPEQTLHQGAVAREVFDVSGAGDTVIASLVAGHVAGLGPLDLLQLANVAAGIVVAKVGTVAVDQAAVLQALHAKSHTLMDSVYALDELGTLVDEWRSRGERVVFTNGCFDIVHAGHVTYLHKAAAEGDRLIVAINTDRSVRALKGDSRPVTGQDDRACVVAALAAVDAVVFFDESTPLNVINKLRPDVLVKGGDYARDGVVGGDEVESWGGRVVLVPLVEGHSTSNLIRKIAG